MLVSSSNILNSQSKDDSLRICHFPQRKLSLERADHLSALSPHILVLTQGSLSSEKTDKEDENKITGRRKSMETGWVCSGCH